MEITIFKDIILNIIFITFPLLLYLLLSIYKDNISKNCNDSILKLALLTSLYLCLRFGIITSNNKILLFCNIPIVISFIKKKPFFAFSLSLINIIYCYQISELLLAVTFIKYFSYFVLYLFANKKKLSINNFILSTAVLQGFFLSFEYFFLETGATINDVIILIILVFIYHTITFFIVYIFKTIEKVQKLNFTIKSLEKDKKMKNALFKLTHEIKNPLAVCKGYLEIMDLNKREKTEKYIRIMQEEIDRSLNIMTDFIQFNKIKISKEKISINDLLEDTHESFKMICKTRGIKILYDNSNNNIFINGDYDRLKQVLVNILKNSVEAIDKNGTIKIETKKIANYIEIIVVDDGIGMSSDTLIKVKEMFYTTKPSGTGLGVALSNEIIEAHGGTLIYDSVLNKGTTVKIKLPIEK